MTAEEKKILEKLITVQESIIRAVAFLRGLSWFTIGAVIGLMIYLLTK